MQEYPFASHGSEYERLRLIEDSFDEKSKKHLLKAGLKKGMNCLEVGLGAGSLASWMKKEVGAEGSVLGVDLTTEHADINEGYELLEGNILELEIATDFDLIHLRYVLIHNTAAKAIIQRLYTLLKPGGKLVIEEPDFTLAKWMDAKELQACKRVNSAVCKMFERKGLRPHYGSIVHLELKEAGFKTLESKSYLHLCGGDEDVANVMALSAEALSDAYLATGVCSKEDIDAYIQACKDPDSLGVYYATVAHLAVKDSVAIITEEAKIKKTIAREDGIFRIEEEAEISESFVLMKQLRPHLNSEEFNQHIQTQIKEGYHLFCMRKESEIVALCGCKVSINLAWGRHLYIDDLVTSTDRRSLGYGKEMMEFLFGFAKEKGCGEIHLDSGVQRFQAHKFYLREGFKIASHHLSKEL
jgi:ubiquinone/menaquinone biosynthesis C-methylase UbiE/GNAT superfamily N-acetyltransferase